MFTKELNSIIAPCGNVFLPYGLNNKPFPMGAYTLISMKEIKLTQGYTALVDDEDYDYLNQWTWYPKKIKNLVYAVRLIYKNGKPTFKMMHHFLINIPKGKVTDHIDCNGLNNQKSNLRICTQAQNLENRRSFGVSKYIGVSYNGKYIQAQISINGKNIKLGYFKTEEQAAMAYDKKAKEIRGSFAKLNFPNISNHEKA